MSRCPNQRNSRSGRTERTVGRADDQNRESRPLFQIPRDGFDERVPGSHPGEIGQQRPHPFRGRINLDTSFNPVLSHT